jgi:DnaJ family protein B protein 12
VFNMGGGPGIRVHQFGGARPRRRPRDPNEPPEPPANLMSTILGLLPLIALFILPLLSSLFSGSETAAGPSMRFDGPVAPHTEHRLTNRLKVDYYVNPAEVAQYNPHKLSQLDKKAEASYIQQLNIGCQEELDMQQRLVNEAQGWFIQDADKMQQARMMKMKNCDRLESLGKGRSY